MPRRAAALRVVVLIPFLAFACGAGSAIASPASVPPHVVALANALAAHRPAASALPTGFRQRGCRLPNGQVSCPVHISRYPDRFAVIYYVLLARKPGPQNVTLNYTIYAARSAARTAFQYRRHLRPQIAGIANVRPTAGLKPYPGFLADEFADFPLPPSALNEPCYRPESCITTRAWGLVGNVIVSANAGLSLLTGNAAEAIKLAKAGIQHLLEVERTVK